MSLWINDPIINERKRILLCKYVWGVPNPNTVLRDSRLHGNEVSVQTLGVARVTGKGRPRIEYGELLSL